MKGNRAVDFLLTYGWVIIIVLISLAVLVYVGLFNIGWFNNSTSAIRNINNSNNVSLSTYVCNNLDNGHAVFINVMKSKYDIEKNLNLVIKNIYGNETSARQWDNNGVMCNLGSEICQKDYLWCMHLTMIIPVNYTDWNNWYYNKTEVK